MNCAEVNEVLQFFANELELRHVDSNDIENCLRLDNDDDNCKSQSIHKSEYLLQELAIRLYIQTKKAETVFNKLDEHGKGVVVVQDLQRVVSDVFACDDNINDDDLHEMVDMFDESGDDVLTLNDFIRIARAINL
jgi:Ca2+-binding EF-hand superfamily protein